MVMFKVKNENEWKKSYIAEFNQMRQEYEEKLSKKQIEINLLREEVQNLRSMKSTLKPKQKQITDDDIGSIKELRNDGCSYSEIANKTRWSKATVSRVLNGLYD